jgi:aspartate racemase
MQERVMAGIYQGVKAGNLEMGEAEFLAAANHLADKGADAILLACTEIPLVLKNAYLEVDGDQGAQRAIPLIDTLEAQAREAIARARVPATPGLVQQVRQLLARPPEAPGELAHA